MKPTRIALLGATGSIGRQTLEVVRAHPDRFRVVAASAHRRVEPLVSLAQEHGIAMAMHMAGSPVSCLANVHCAAATENFLVLENHSVDYAPWNDLVIGLPKPIIQDGYIDVPEKPGLGFDDINEEVVRAHIDPDDPGFFEPTDVWDRERSNDRLWS